MCSTAPVLCTIDELDNYSFSMTSFQHPNDGPTPLCPPQNGTQTNNPTWFAFVAWCTSLTLFVDISNCTPFLGFTNGVQIAIYSGCGPYTPVACNTSASDCNTNDKTLIMNNLVIGNTYYFLIDGCAGAYCDVSIDVVGVCGEAMIENWNLPMTGPDQSCVGNSDLFSVESLDGATDYHWYLNGMLVDEGEEMTSFTQIWNTPGTYQICVDASNIPCIPESNPPPQLCKTIQIFEADAGTIEATPNPLCPGQLVTVTSSGFITGPGYQHWIIITNEAGIITSISNGTQIGFNHLTCGSFTAYTYSFHPAGGASPPGLGSPISILNCNGECCELEMITIEFEDNIDPVFTNPPPDLMLTCFDLIPPVQTLAWTDNCTGSGNIAGTETGIVNMCTGGVLVREWEYSDLCGNTVTHQQMISVSPIPTANFINPPADITVDCNGIPSSTPSLVVANTGAGGCLIMSLVAPVQNGTPTVCGGTYSYVWNFTDLCGRNVMHVQNITVTPIAAPMFMNIPPNLTIECADIPMSAPLLNYSNGGTGNCQISGSVPAVTTGSANLCGGMLQNKWDYVDVCGRMISATQTITVNPVPAAVFVNPPPDITINCASIPVSISALNYTNGLSGNCLIGGSVVPVTNNNANACGGAIVSTWQFTDACGRNLSHTQTITVTPAPLPVWINPPNDTTIECSMLPQTIPALAYSNGGSGVCAITGSVPGVQTVFDICQGLVAWQWNFVDQCGNAIVHTRNITTTTPPPVVFMSPPADITVNCDAVSLVIPSLMYTNNSGGPCLVSGSVVGIQSGSYSSCGGALVRTWQVADPCGVIYSHTQNITVNPASPPVFLTPPADVTINCNQVPVVPPALTYSNNLLGTCAITGVVPATIGGSFNVCGGILIYTWTVIDNCGNNISHSQNLTVLPAPPPAFINSPADITLSCDQVPATPPSLSFSNGQFGSCAITGTIPASVTGMYDACGGAITYLWSFTDLCGTVITHAQQVSVTPAADPVWIDPPGDMILGCDDDYLPPDDLLYTNNLSGACTIGGSVPPTVSLNGNVYTHIWTYIHPCTGATISHVQQVTIVPIPEIAISPDEVFICAEDVFDLSTIIVTEVNGQIITVTFHTDSPAGPGNQLASPLWTAEFDEEFYILATNSFGCTDEVLFDFYVEPLPNAGEDVELDICQTETVNLDNLLDSDADSGGEWLDADGSGADLGNPSNVSFQFVDPGVYDFLYYVSINDCPADTSVIELTLYGPPDFSIDSVYCTTSNTEYVVVINGTNISVSPSEGNVVMFPGGVMIEHIPIDEQLSFDIYDSDIQCVFTYFVNAPNCNCPSVPAPTNPMNAEICIGETNPALTVTVGTGLIANWFDAAIGGTLIATNTIAYTPGESLPGLYSYFVETESIEFPGCTSNVRTIVTLRIYPLPDASDASIEFCDDAQTGMLSVDLFDWTAEISVNPSYTFSFHSTFGNAQSGASPLSMPVTASLGTNAYYARVIDINGCVSVVLIEVELNPLPSFGIVTTPETCPGSADGILELTGIMFADQYTISFNNTAYNNQFIFPGLDTGTYDLVFVNSLTLCQTTAQFTIGAGMQLSVATTSLACNDNGTDTDPSDDFYSVEILVSTDGTTMSYELFANDSPQGTYNYDQTVTITVPATNQPLSLVAVDITFGCADTLITNTLTTCSSDCDILIGTLVQVCSDNGTPVDPADDYHTITLNTSAVNGSASNQYAVYFNGVLTYVFNYGMSESFNLPVSAPAPVIRLEDVSDPQCVFNLVLDPLIGCSNQCVIPAPDVQYTCNNNGTPADVTDDTYSIVFTVTVTNPGPSGLVNILVDGVLDQSVPVNTEVTLSLPADDGTHTIQIVDADQPACDVEWNTIPLIHCSTLCIISPGWDPLVCNDNNTPLDPSDDVYEITWNASAVFGAANMMYEIELDGNAIGIGTYGDDEMLTIPADGSPHTLLLIDADDQNCRIQWNLPVLHHCSDDCTLSVTVIDKYCNNNGTNQTEDDDIWFIVIIVNGVNIPSGQWSVNGQPVGTLGVQDTLGPFLISDSDQTIVFDAVGSTCSDNTTVAPSPACSSCDQTIDAGPDAVLDCGMPTAQLTVTSGSPGNASWEDPGGGVTQTATINAALAGTYIATVSFVDGCAFSDTVLVSADPTLPSVWGGADQNLDCEIRDALLEAEVLVGSAGVIFEWTNSSGNVISMSGSVGVTQPGTYFIRIYDPVVDCWSGQDAVVVQDISNQPSAIIYADPGNILSCVIEFIVLNSEQESNVQYTWVSQGQTYTDSTLIIYEGGTVTLIALDTITRCESKDSMTVQAVIEYPFIIVDPPLSLSCDRTSVVLDASGSIPSSGGNFIWTSLAGDTIGTNAMLSVQQPGTYVVELNDPANGCVSFDTIDIIDISEFPELIPADDVELPCDSENQSLNASLIAPLTGVTYEWIPRQGGQILGSTDEAQATVSGQGMYIVIATHASSLCTDSDTIFVTEIANKPTAIISQVSDANCVEVADGMIQIMDVEGGLEPFTYFIDGIQVTEALITDLSAGTYLLEIEDAKGCVLDTLLTVINGEEVMVDLEAVVNIEAGDRHLLMAGVNISAAEISSVKWTPGTHLSCDTCLITQASPEEDVTYTVTVTDIYGCTGEATVMIRVINRTTVFVPNIISPNQDNINDYFTIFTSDPEARVLSMRIFNRWGAILFEKFNFQPNIPSEGWDGTFKNEPLNPAVFVFMIELETQHGIIEILKGDVTIIR